MKKQSYSRVKKGNADKKLENHFESFNDNVEGSFPRLCFLKNYTDLFTGFR